MQRSDQKNRSLRSRLLRVIQKFRSSSSPLPQRGTDRASTSTPVPVPQMDGAESSAQAPARIDNAYAAIVGSPANADDPTTGSVVYEGLKTILQGLYDCSDVFLPLKAAAGGLLTIFKIVDVSGFEMWFMAFFKMSSCQIEGIREQNGTRSSSGKASGHHDDCPELQETKWVTCSRSPNYNVLRVRHFAILSGSCSAFINVFPGPLPFN